MFYKQFKFQQCIFQTKDTVCALMQRKKEYKFFLYIRGAKTKIKPCFHLEEISHKSWRWRRQ